MIKHKYISIITALFMAVAVLITSIAYVNPEVFSSVVGKSELDYVSALDKTKIMSIEIIADEKQWADMLKNATSEEYIHATVIINGLRIENVGIRPKGNSSLSMVASDETTDRFSFKIEFDHYITGQTWLGLDKLVVNNMQGDATYLKEYISYDMMDYIGVESPLYSFSDIIVNGKDWGFYLAVEALDDSYAKRVYGNNHGELYKPESMGMRGEGKMNEFINRGDENQQMQPPAINQNPQGQQTMPPFENNQNMQNDMGNKGGMASGGISLQYTDDQISSYSAIFENSVFDTTNNDYNRVIKSLKKLSKGEDLEETVDIEATLKYFAAHTFTVNLDSYISNMAHNYYLYESDGQLTILPWDYNLAFGGFQAGNATSVVNFPIDTPVSGGSLSDRPLLGKLLEVSEYKKLYHSYLQELITGYFNSGIFSQTIDSMSTLISSHVQDDPTAFYKFDEFQAGVTELKELGLLRAKSIEGQLKGTIPSTTEGQSSDSSKLIDSSSVNLSLLGSQGGRGGIGGVGFNQEAIQKSMEIFQTVGDNELTEEQMSTLHELGLSDDQISEMRTMSKNFPNGQRQNGNRPNGMGGNMQNMNNPPAGNNRPNIGQSDEVSSGYDKNTWILLWVSTSIFLAGFAFVFLYKRKRAN